MLLSPSLSFKFHCLLRVKLTCCREVAPGCTSCTAIHLLIMILVQPVSRVAEMWNVAPVFPCASQSRKASVVDANPAAFVYSGVDSCGAGAGCSVLGVARAKCFFWLLSGCLPFPWHALAMPCVLHFEHKPSSLSCTQSVCAVRHIRMNHMIGSFLGRICVFLCFGHCCFWQAFWFSC